MRSMFGIIIGLFLTTNVWAAAKDKVKEKDKEKAKVEAKAESKENVKAGFVVGEIQRPEPIEGQLGEPGAPSLEEQQQLLAKSLLAKGLCNVSYYGEEFCAKQQAKTFKVTDQLGSATTETSLLGGKTEGL